MVARPVVTMRLKLKLHSEIIVHQGTNRVGTKSEKPAPISGAGLSTFAIGSAEEVAEHACARLGAGGGVDLVRFLTGELHGLL